MANFQLVNLDYHTQKDPRMGETLRQIQDLLSGLATQTGSALQGPQATPAPPTALNVTAASGVFDFQITDNEPSQSGISPDYFIEYSTTPGFSQPVAIHLGPSRNHRAFLGNQNLYFRAYKQRGRASQPSTKVYFGTGTNPTIVNGGGGIVGPTIQTSAGSGTAPTTGLQGGVGYGLLPVR